jgi:hypothetical protein
MVSTFQENACSEGTVQPRMGHEGPARVGSQHHTVAGHFMTPHTHCIGGWVGCMQNVFNFVNDCKVTLPPPPQNHIPDDELEKLHACMYTSMGIGFYLTEQVTFIQY